MAFSERAELTLRIESMPCPATPEALQAQQVQEPAEAMRRLLKILDQTVRQRPLMYMCLNNLR
jgi:hypothetical protein